VEKEKNIQKSFIIYILHLVFVSMDKPRGLRFVHVEQILNAHKKFGWKTLREYLRDRIADGRVILNLTQRNRWWGHQAV
jgi:hypothetical protein